jgi:2,3-dihydro-2,3-dihydroxybenzoate dehydrogenase
MLTPTPEPTPGRAALPVALVVGAAGGIGRAIVETLLDGGYRVAAADLDAGNLATLAGAHPRLDHGALVDVRDAAAIDELVDGIERHVGPIDALVNAAGVLHASSALAQSDDDWAVVHDVNVGGVMRASRAVARRMAVRQRGSIVTIGSNAAAVARDGLSAYAASKAAARHYTLCLGVELAPLGIRCNVVSPGSTETPMLQRAWDGAAPAGGGLDGAAHRAAIAGTPEAFWPGIPLGRIAAPAQIAQTVAFLLSDAASHITMHDLRVDGGATLGA